MRTLFFGLCLPVVLVTSALADTGYTEARHNETYVLVPQADGTAALTSTVSRLDYYALRPDCFAEHPVYGMGFWKSVDAGWQIEMGRSVLARFPNQPLPFEGVDCSKGLESGG